MVRVADRTSRSGPPGRDSLPASGLEAERAPLDLVGRELSSPESSQCQNRFAEHWGLTMSEEPMLVEGEGVAEDPSQACGGDSRRVNCHEMAARATGFRTVPH